MRLGIMQPYFFPYIGYFSLIKHVDEFILFDTPQFIRHGWIERNRIKNAGGGYVYISVPLLKHSQKTAIQNILINNEMDWKNKILAQLVHYKKAPYYKEVTEMLRALFEKEYLDIVTLDKVTLEKVCEYLNIDTEIKVFSQMNLEIEQVLALDEWALNICKAIPGANEYWNPPGGKAFFDVSKYDKAGIDIRFQEVEITEYQQGKNAFEAGLSIIDVMMYNSSQTIHRMMDNFKLT
ncbi:MAG: WbqC family protein [Lachnospiraceae bacterium]|nr:WbqC family protein [Lachnospiraceae bacterium]